MNVKPAIQNSVLIAPKRVRRQAGPFFDERKMISEHRVYCFRLRLHVHRVSTEPVPLIAVQHFC